jgi:D-amino-acid dehydrogenase
MSPVLVLGAGMVGTCTALHLQQRGHQVLLVDKKDAGRETSFGNAGLIQREAVEPYAFPRQWSKLLQVALGRPVDVHYHGSALPGLARALFSYWRESAPERHKVASLHHARLIAQCLAAHQHLMEELGAQDLVRREGFRKVYRSPNAFAQALKDAQRLEGQFGVRFAALDAGALAQAEPALRSVLAGAVHWLDTWSVSDPGELVARYARLFEQRGGRLVHANAHTLQAHGVGWRVRADEGWLEAAQAVIALGPWSDALIRPMGYHLPLFVKRGYHQHYTGASLNLPTLDAEKGFLLLPTAQGTRLTTGAEFARMGAPATPVQLGRAERAARQLVDLGPALAAPPWLGSRPCTPDMLPVMGPAPRHRGLWFNFGHAHQGFTLGPVAGRLVAELISGQTPWLDPTSYRAERFL